MDCCVCVLFLDFGLSPSLLPEIGNGCCSRTQRQWVLQIYHSGPRSYFAAICCKQARAVFSKAGRAQFSVVHNTDGTETYVLWSPHAYALLTPTTSRPENKCPLCAQLNMMHNFTKSIEIFKQLIDCYLSSGALVWPHEYDYKILKSTVNLKIWRKCIKCMWSNANIICEL